MTQDELKKTLEAHKKWLNDEDSSECADLRRADLRRADLSGADLRGADLSGADLRRADLRRADLRRADLRRAGLSGADLSGADLRRADLRRADLSGADLRGADLRHADLRGVDLRGAGLRHADLSGAKGLLSAINYMESHFERTADGYIAYKTFGARYKVPSKWEVKPGAVIEENVNMCRADVCGCGINVAPLGWVKANYGGKIWQVLIRWEWLCGVCVPYNTDGKIRCERVELVKEVSKNEETYTSRI